VGRKINLTKLDMILPWAGSWIAGWVDEYFQRYILFLVSADDLRDASITKAGKATKPGT